MQDGATMGLRMGAALIKRDCRQTHLRTGLRSSLLGQANAINSVWRIISDLYDGREIVHCRVQTPLVYIDHNPWCKPMSSKECSTKKMPASDIGDFRRPYNPDVQDLRQCCLSSALRSVSQLVKYLT